MKATVAVATATAAYPRATARTPASRRERNAARLPVARAARAQPIKGRRDWPAMARANSHPQKKGSPYSRVELTNSVHENGGSYPSQNVQMRGSESPDARVVSSMRRRIGAQAYSGPAQRLQCAPRDRPKTGPNHIRSVQRHPSAYRAMPASSAIPARPSHAAPASMTGRIESTLLANGHALSPRAVMLWVIGYMAISVPPSNHFC